MSFSSEVKEGLSKINNYNSDILEAELLGYFISGNLIEKNEKFEFITENEFNIEHLYKILYNLNINYEPEIRGKCFIAQINESDIKKIRDKYKNIKGENRKNIVKGAFLGAGSINNPEKNYHLEIIFLIELYSDFIKNICLEYGINFKKIKVKDKYQLYLKESDEISKFLALIGANLSVLKFEDIRVIKEMKNKVNRTVNCETANLNKTIDASIRQIEDIKLIKLKKKFDKMPKELQIIANLRLKNPELSLKDLGQMLEPKLNKSAINRRFAKIHEIAEDK